LAEIYFASILSNGTVAFPHEHNPEKAVADLTSLGIASIAIETDFFITERFVMEVIHDICQNRKAEISNLQMDTLLSDLHNVSKAYRGTTIHGTLFERIFITKIFQMKDTVTTVGKLPFIPADLPDSWKLVPFQPERMCDSYDIKSSSIPAFVASQKAINVCFSPPKECRPDMILMLPPVANDAVKRRAITLGSAVYSKNVPEQKIYEQYRSTDMSRCYLEAANDIIHVEGAREEWVKLGLHEVVSIRVNIALPYRVADGLRNCNPKPKVGKLLDSGYLEEIEEIEPDVDVHLDMSNIYLLIGPKEQNESLYRLLSVMTKKST
jgi:hypothetical protein